MKKTILIILLAMPFIARAQSIFGFSFDEPLPSNIAACSNSLKSVEDIIRANVTCYVETPNVDRFAKKDYSIRYIFFKEEERIALSSMPVVIASMDGNKLSQLRIPVNRYRHEQDKTLEKLIDHFGKPKDQRRMERHPVGNKNVPEGAILSSWDANGLRVTYIGYFYPDKGGILAIDKGKR